MPTLESSDLPAPPIPAGLRLRAFRYFTLDTERLLASKLVAKGPPAACWAALMLWIAAMKQTPAGSLPDDDEVLRGFSRAGNRWQRVRAQAMHGWYKCSDGRLYHAMVTDQVLKIVAAAQKVSRKRPNLGFPTVTNQGLPVLRPPQNTDRPMELPSSLINQVLPNNSENFLIFDKDKEGSSPISVGLSNLPPPSNSARATRAGGRAHKARTSKDNIPFIDEWWQTEQGTRDMAKAVDVLEKPGETWARWRHRIFARLKALKGDEA